MSLPHRDNFKWNINELLSYVFGPIGPIDNAHPILPDYSEEFDERRAGLGM